MTKAEFSEQFKRLRVAGYRLPSFLPGESVKDLTDEWYRTFGSCTKDELAHAIDELKKVKADTFWPAPGELWTHVYEYRKARRIRLQAQMPDYQDTPSGERQQLAAMFRDFAKRLSAQMAMPHAEAQVPPDHVLLEQEEQDRTAEESQ